MGASAVLAGLVAATRWDWGAPLAAAVFGPLLLVDLAYLAANSLKVVDGGWFPLATALAIGYVVAIGAAAAGSFGTSSTATRSPPAASSPSSTRS
jgi:KUP system potassium uptake protein